MVTLLNRKMINEEYVIFKSQVEPGIQYYENNFKILQTYIPLVHKTRFVSQMKQKPLKLI
jgi:hypothetical protein